MYVEYIAKFPAFIWLFGLTAAVIFLPLGRPVSDCHCSTPSRDLRLFLAGCLPLPQALRADHVACELGTAPGLIVQTSFLVVSLRPEGSQL